MTVVGRPRPVKDPDQELARSLRDTWIQQNPRFNDAEKAVIVAEEAAKRTPWNEDPLVYVQSVKAALKAVSEAKENLAAVAAELKGFYDREAGAGE